MENTAKMKTGVRWIYMIVGVIALLFAGILYAWSILKAPLAKEFGWNAAQLAINYTFAVSFFVIGGFLSGTMTKKTSPRTRLLIAAVLFFAGFFITSRMGGNIIVLYLSYGVLCGLGIGFVYNTVISVINAWFPDKRGLAAGLLLTGFGLNSLVIAKIADIFIKMPSVGWRTTFFILAIVTSAVFVAAAFIVKNPPAGIKLPAPKGAAKKDAGDLEPRDYTPVEMLKRPSFWKLFIFFILLAAVGSAAISFAKDILKDAGSSDDLAVTLVGLIAIGNAVGRLASGWFFDAIGRRKTQYVMSAVAIAAPLVVVVALVTHSLAIAVIGLFICYISFGFAPTGSTAFISAFYGQKHFPLNLSILNLQLVLTSFAAPLAGVIKDSTGSFVTTFVILIGFSLVGLVLNLTMRKP